MGEVVGFLSDCSRGLVNVCVLLSIFYLTYLYIYYTYIHLFSFNNLSYYIDNFNSFINVYICYYRGSIFMWFFFWCVFGF